MVRLFHSWRYITQEKGWRRGVAHLWGIGRLGILPWQTLCFWAGSELIRGISWSGKILLQKWMNFYSKVLARFATAGGIKLRVGLEVSPEGGLPEQKVEETNAALRELGVEGEAAKIQQ